MKRQVGGDGEKKGVVAALRPGPPGGLLLVSPAVSLPGPPGTRTGAQVRRDRSRGACLDTGRGEGGGRGVGRLSRTLQKPSAVPPPPPQLSRPQRFDPPLSPITPWFFFTPSPNWWSNHWLGKFARCSPECFRRVKTGGDGRARGQRSGETPGLRAGTPPEAPLMP